MVRSKSEKPLLKIRVHGAAFKPGRIPVPLLVRICNEAQTAVNRQAEALEGKRSLRPGPVVANIARECTLELFGLRKGSTTLNFARAAGQGKLVESQSLSFEAVAGVAVAIKAASQTRGRGAVPDIGVLDTLNNLGDTFDRGISKIEWIVPAHNGTKRLAAQFDPSVRAKIVSRIHKPTTSVSSTVEGTLELAEGKCRINPPVGAPILCGFEQEKAGAVFDAMRKSVKVTMDNKTHKIENIEITSRPDTLGSSSFFEAKTIEQLLAEQDIHAVTDLSALSGALPDEDLDDMVAEIYQARKV
jgi:hypothetical protein